MVPKETQLDGGGRDAEEAAAAAEIVEALDAEEKDEEKTLGSTDGFAVAGRRDGDVLGRRGKGFEVDEAALVVVEEPLTAGRATAEDDAVEEAAVVVLSGGG